MSEESEEPAGVSKTVTWIMALVAALFLGMGGFILSSFSSRINQLEATLSHQSTDITRLQASQEFRQETNVGIETRLEKIETKLDELREQVRRQGR